MPISLEAFMLAVAEKMKLKGFGKDGLGEGLDFFKPEDFYLKQLVNLACGEKPNLEDAVPDADDAEVEIFKKARKHLSPSVFEFEYWKNKWESNGAKLFMYSTAVENIRIMKKRTTANSSKINMASKSICIAKKWRNPKTQ